MTREVGDRGRYRRRRWCGLTRSATADSKKRDEAEEKSSAERGNRLAGWVCRVSNFHVPSRLKDVTAEILVFHDVGKLLVHVRGVDLDGFLLEVGSFEREFVQNLF